MGTSDTGFLDQSRKRKSASIEADTWLPMLTSLDYYTAPSLADIHFNENMDSGYVSRIPNFVVGRSDYGQIEFLGETDIRQLDIEKIVKFGRHNVSVYENESDKPPVGHGLNKPATVTLILKPRTACLQREPEKFESKLKKCTERMGACFISFNSSTGEWKFLVQHFSRFGLDEDDEEDIFMDDDAVGQDDGIEDIPMDPEEVALSHSLPAHLGLDPAKMKEMRMIMFPMDEEDEESYRPHPPEWRNVGLEHLRVDSPSSSAKASSHRVAAQGSAKKTINKSSPLRKSPVALLDYRDGGFNMSPPRNILMARQNTGLRLRTRVEGFKMESKHTTPLEGHCSRNIVDAALFMGRSFRVGWGPNGALVHSGSPVCNPGKGLSSVITIERVAMDKCVRDEKHELNEDLVDLCFSAPLSLHKSLDHECTQGGEDSSNLKMQKVVSSRFALSDICRDYIEIVEKQLDVPGLSLSARLIMMHQVMIWELLKVLFSERGTMEHSRIACHEIDEDDETMLLDKKDGSFDIDIEAKPHIRRANFSIWLQDSVCHRVQEEVSCMNDTNDLEHILILLTGKQLDAAVELAAARGDVRLAVLLSQAAGSMVNRNDMAQQLDVWKNNGMDFNFIEKDRLKVYELLAGNVQVAVSNFSVDWKRFLGLLMWYQLPPDASLPLIINTYQQLLGEGRVPHPVPIYVDEGLVGQGVDRREGDHYDLSYYLMLLHSEEDKSDVFLKTMFSALASTYDALDYHMIWHQRSILEAIGVFSSNDLHILDMSYISQLLFLGQCHWAIYVAIHMPYCEDFPYIQANIIKEILFQYCEIWSGDETQQHFIEDLGIPSHWMHEALATYFQYYGNLPKALEHFIDCSNWQKAHSIFMTSVAHPLFLSYQDSEIWRLVCLMEDHKKEISNWSLGGALFIDFYDLRSSMQEDKKSGKLERLEHMTTACRGFFRRLNESLSVWGNKLPVQARATYSSMAEQLSNLLVSIHDDSITAQMSCFDAVLSAPVAEDIRSSHLQNAVSLFAYYISETENQRISETVA